MKLYKFWPTESALKNLKQQRLKLSKISELNDPFEFASIDLRDKAVRIAFSKWRLDQDKTKAVFSFCSSHYSPLMWAHYADFHKGLCLEFEVKKELLHEVKYIDSRSTKIRKGDDFSKAMKSTIFFHEISTTKFAHWSYEKEQRLIRPIEDCVEDGGLIFMPIGSECRLSKVYLGARFDKSKISELVTHIKPYDVQIKMKRPAFRDFRVVERQDWQAPN
jgi:Protein of unknown function (DUF2971)